MSVRTDEPDIFPNIRDIVATGTTFSNPESKRTRPVCYDPTIRTLCQIQDNPTLGLHFGTIPFTAAFVTDLLLVVINDSIANTATTSRIDVNLLFATIGTNKLVSTHR